MIFVKEAVKFSLPFLFQVKSCAQVISSGNFCIVVREKYIWLDLPHEFKEFHGSIVFP